MGLGAPRHFIDFEAARLSLPHHAGMRAYGLLAFQWSCHTASRDGRLTPRGWLNTLERWPNLAFVDTLRQALGDEGPVLTWTSFERATLADVARELALPGREAGDRIEWLTKPKAFRRFASAPFRKRDIFGDQKPLDTVPERTRP